ncbi:MAG: hypothetical protein H0W46_10725, partial [Acidimicrobiia bacterium]|nr:hypothetical protein [Acidimicrobiia bacterium]
VDAALAALALPPLPDTRTRLLVRFAGPYRSVDAHPEWIATDPAELVAETRRMIHEDGGVRLAEHITKELQSLGMAGEYVDAWLACQPVRVVDGLVVALTGTPGDVAERALDVTGQPLSTEEMTAWVPGPPELTAALWRGRDRRFVITVDDELALADWGRDDVATATDGRRPALLRVEVDTAVLAGHDAPIEPGLAHALSLRHGSRRTFPTRYGPVTLTYDDATPRRGSVRAVALAVGAVTGNVLEITLYPDGLGTTVRLLPSPAAS